MHWDCLSHRKSLCQVEQGEPSPGGLLLLSIHSPGSAIQGVSVAILRPAEITRHFLAKVHFFAADCPARTTALKRLAPCGWRTASQIAGVRGPF